MQDVTGSVWQFFVTDLELLQQFLLLYKSLFHFCFENSGLGSICLVMEHTPTLYAVQIVRRAGSRRGRPKVCQAARATSGARLVQIYG